MKISQDAGVETTVAASAGVPQERKIPLRTPNFNFDSLPDRWFADSLVATSIVNALHLLFPDGERFFIRSVNHYKGSVGDDAELVKAIRDFAGQEGRHGYEHERVFAKMREQGYPVDSFLKVFKGFAFEFIEKKSPHALRLATTAGVEHFTATLGRVALDTDVLTRMDPAMADLLRWHALEEIEHQDVAFDVLQRVNPSLALRGAGLAFAGLMVFPFWLGGSLYLIGTKARSIDDLRSKTGTNPYKMIPWRKLGKAVVDYLKPSFTPGEAGDDIRIAETRAWYMKRQEGARAAKAA